MAWYEVDGATIHQKVANEYASEAYARFDDVIAAFQNDTGMHQVSAAAFAVAGAVIEGVCETTNLPWRLEELELSCLLGNVPVWLLNDVEATAYGMLYLHDDDKLIINSGVARAANRAVIAAGTGLGEATLFYVDKRFVPSASEGGHCSFAPQSEMEVALLRYLQQQYSGHVSFERVVSGMGISNIYAFLHDYHHAAPSELLLALRAGEDINAAIARHAAQKSDALAQECMQLFFKLYAQEAGNLALKSMALGGLYIGGGIITKTLALFDSDAFMEHFSAKGRFEPMLRQMPVTLSKRSDTALEGTAHFLVDRLSL